MRHSDWDSIILGNTITDVNQKVMFKNSDMPFAKKHDIKFFLRIDDTDLERSSQKYTNSIISDLEWLNIEYFDIFKQSERMSKYIDVFNYLKKKDFIYPCFESSEELSLKRKIIR